LLTLNRALSPVVSDQPLQRQNVGRGEPPAG
jgi:hypothetical protein